ncbi:hypothetical protein RFI_35553, partial [Reticulomyxa filosa]
NDLCFKVVLVGDPGTSKTLSLEILRYNLSESKIEDFQAKLNEENFNLQVKPLHIVSFQCTQDSKPFRIIERWEKALSYSKDPTIWAVLLLDEIGLAERSKHSPLKVLHHLLEHPKIAFVGLSNWPLDAAKMNRVIMHKIPSVSSKDLEDIAKGMYKVKQQGSDPTKISTSENDIKLLVNVFKDLSAIKTTNSLTFGETNVLGTRDFYALIRHYLEKGQSLRESFEEKNKCWKKMNPWGSLQCIKANIEDVRCRHCLLASSSQYSWLLLLDHNILPYSDVVFLFESRFPADLIATTNYDYLHKVINCMETGKTVILFNLKSIHECLYDMLNQRYQINRQGYFILFFILFAFLNNKTKNVLIGQRVCGMSVESRSRECYVADSFKCIVVIQEKDFEDSMQKAFFNRFERQWISYCKSLSPSLTKKAEAFQKYLCKIYDTSNQELSSLFCGFNEDTIPSAISCALSLESLSSTDSKNEELTPN